MAENKKSFIFYTDWSATFNELPDDKAGQLIKYLLNYVNDEKPCTEDILIKAVFANIKNQLKRDLSKWEESTEKKSMNGRLGNLKRWNSDLHSKVINDSLTLEQAEAIAINRKASHPDRTVSQKVANIAVNDNVTVTVNDNVKEEIEYIYSIYPSKCLVRNVSTGKNKSDKTKINTLLKSKTKEQVETTIRNYLKECSREKQMIKNFGTFLNNFPDDESSVEMPKEKLYRVKWTSEPEKIVPLAKAEHFKRSFDLPGFNFKMEEV